MDENNKILIYTGQDGLTKIDVKLEEDTLWLTQAQMCELYQTSKSNVSEHIKHIFEEGELLEESVVRKFRTTATDGKSYLTTFYNLDMIIALGYRVRSITATRFRQWATLRLKEYITKGFTLDDDRLKKLGGGGYWKELLERIRDKKVMAENVGSSDIWSDGVEKSENCRTQTLPLMLLLRRLPPRAKRQLPQRKRLQQRRPLLPRQRRLLLPRQRKRLPQRRLLLARPRRPLLLKRNSLFLLTLIPTNKKVAHSLRVGDLLHFLRGLSDEYTALFLWRIAFFVILLLYLIASHCSTDNGHS